LILYQEENENSLLVLNCFRCRKYEKRIIMNNDKFPHLTPEELARITQQLSEGEEEEVLALWTEEYQTKVLNFLAKQKQQAFQAGYEAGKKLSQKSNS
jgi:hypothetical protein